MEYLISKTTLDGRINADILYTITFTYNKELSLGSDVEIFSHPSLGEEAIAYVPISIIREEGMYLLNHVLLCWITILISKMLTFMTAIQHLLPEFVNKERSTNSAESWQCISEWMKDCLNSHTRCDQERKLDWWPTRLLDLGNSGDNLRLIVTSETQPSGPYVTLSHCCKSNVD
jgi:hypothetical protein